jgi:signal transduction histidine kinase/ActR/RegA family two-component response regulator
MSPREQRRGTSVRLKLVLLLTAALSASGLAFSTVCWFTLREHVEQNLRLRAERIAQDLATSAVYGTLTRDAVLLRENCARSVETEQVESVAILLPSGEPLVEMGVLPSAPAGRDPSPAPRDFSGSLRDPLITARHPILLEARDGQEGPPPSSALAPSKRTHLLGTAVVALDTAPARALLADWIRISVYLSLALVAAGIVVSMLVAGLALRPLRRLLEGTRRVASGSLDVPVTVRSRDEFGELARSFNEMIHELRRSRRETDEHRHQLEEAIEKRTEQLRATRERLVHSEKLSALGQLVAGVAHDLNNPLTGILGHVQLLRAAQSDPKIAARLQRIEAEARRSQKIIENLLLFSEKRPLARQQVGINGLIERTVDLLHMQIRQDILVILDLQPDLPLVDGDFHQLQQVFVNLIKNAVQAVRAEKKGGRILVMTRADGDRVLVHVDDDGPGIPEDRRHQLFDPFFTTKPPGEGTGLGLSICYQITRRHGGRIEITESPLGGARFSLELPRVPIGAGAGPPAETESGSSAVQGAGQPILVVDDEPAVCEVLFETLKRSGYGVHSALTLREAKRKIDRDHFDLILADYRLADGDASQLWEHLKEVKPEALRRFVVMTGDSLSPDVSVFIEAAGCPVLPKPFQLRDVLRFVSRALEAEGSNEEAPGAS